MAEIKDRPVGIFRLRVRKQYDGKWVSEVRFRTEVLYYTVKNTERSARYGAASWIERQMRLLEKAVIRLDSEYMSLPTNGRKRVDTDK